MPFIDVLALRRSLVAVGMDESQAETLAGALSVVDVGSPVSRREVEEIVAGLERTVRLLRRGLWVMFFFQGVTLALLVWLLELHLGDLVLTVVGA